MVKEIIISVFIICCFTTPFIIGIILEIRKYILRKNGFDKIKIGDRYKQTISDFDDPFSESEIFYYKVIDKKKVGSRRYVRLEYLTNNLTRENDPMRKSVRIEYLLDFYEKC